MLESTVPLELRLLGEVRVVRAGTPCPLPRSRKARALLAYLALHERPVSRDELCRLLWSDPSDPRAALRWTLSKLRPTIEGSGGRVIATEGEFVGLDHAVLEVDLLKLQRLLAADPDVATLLRANQCLAEGCLEGLDDAGTTEFQLWLDQVRGDARSLRRYVLSELVASHEVSDGLTFARQRAALDPLHTGSNLDLLRLLLRTEGRSAAQSTMTRMREQYRADGMSEGELVAGWRAMCAAPVALVVDGDDEAEVPALPERPSLAVLGFRDLGGHERGALLARGLSTDLTSRLARLSHLFVVARASAERMATREMAPREVGRLLGVRYLIEGTTQRSGQQVRVTAALLDAGSGCEIWAEHFDRPIQDLFALQDEVIGDLVAAIDPVIERAEMERALRAPTGHLSAWECYHRGLWHCFRFTSTDTEVAHRLLTRAVQLDPRFSRAYAGLSFTHYSRAFLNVVPRAGDEVQHAIEFAQQAIEVDSQDSMGHWCLGRALFLAHSHDAALAAIDRSLVANPNFAQGFYAKGFIGVHAGLDVESLDPLAQAQRQSPFDPLLFAIRGTRALSYANLGRFEEAARCAGRAVQEPNAHFHIRAIQAACLELAGQHVPATEAARLVLLSDPNYSVELFQRSFPHRDDGHREPLLAAMSRAGLPRATR